MLSAPHGIRWWSIASGDQTTDSVREMARRMNYMAMAGSGWKVVIVNEADRMSSPVETLWLDVLENIPPQGRGGLHHQHQRQDDDAETAFTCVAAREFASPSCRQARVLSSRFSAERCPSTEGIRLSGERSISLIGCPDVEVRKDSAHWYKDVIASNGDNCLDG